MLPAVAVGLHTLPLILQAFLSAFCQCGNTICFHSVKLLLMAIWPLFHPKCLSMCSLPQLSRLQRAELYVICHKFIAGHVIFWTYTIFLGVVLSGLNIYIGRSQWPRDLRRRSAAARLLGLCVQIPPGSWMSVCCECCVMSGRGFCDELITRPEESYRRWCVILCDLETSRMRRPWPTGGCRAKNKQIYMHIIFMLIPITSTAKCMLRRNTYFQLFCR